MASKTEVANMAISNLGTGQEIGNIDTENSQEAAACRRFFNMALEKVLRDFPWPFANVTESAALVDTNPTSEWGYSYRFPSNCMRFIKVLSGSNNDTRQSRVPVKIGKDLSGRLIYTDMEEAEIEYTDKVEDLTIWPSDAILALSFKLAYYIAPRVSKGQTGLKRDMLTSYQGEISNAKANSVNEEQQRENPESEFMRARL